MHSALLITLVNCMKSLPCRGGEGRWSRRERAPSPRPARGRCGTAGAPTGAALAPRPVRGRALTPRGSQAPAAMRGPLLWAGWLLATGCLVGATGSCRHRCCPGRNNACWAPGARRARCYCDSYCQRTGDCCQDYVTTCRRAGEWRRGWHRPGLLCSAASVCCYLLAPYFERSGWVWGCWLGWVCSNVPAVPFFHAERLAGRSAMREPVGVASGLQLLVALSLQA